MARQLGRVDPGAVTRPIGFSEVGVAAQQTPGIFGQNFKTGTEETPDGPTTSGTFAEYFLFSTDSLPAGTFYISTVFALSASMSNTVIGARFVLDGTVPAVAEIAQGTDTAGGLILFAGHSVQVWTAGVHTVGFEFRRAGGSGGVTANFARATVWRAL